MRSPLSGQLLVVKIAFDETLVTLTPHIRDVAVLDLISLLKLDLVKFTIVLEVILVVDFTVTKNCESVLCR